MAYTLTETEITQIRQLIRVEAEELTDEEIGSDTYLLGSVDYIVQQTRRNVPSGILDTTQQSRLDTLATGGGNDYDSFVAALPDGQMAMIRRAVVYRFAGDLLGIHPIYTSTTIGSLVQDQSPDTITETRAHYYQLASDSTWQLVDAITEQATRTPTLPSGLFGKVNLA